MQSHTSIIDPAKWLVKEARKIPGLKKVSPGIIVSASSTEERIKIRPETGCVLVIYYSRRYFQEIRFYGDPEFLAQEIQSIWEKK